MSTTSHPLSLTPNLSLHKLETCYLFSKLFSDLEPNTAISVVYLPFLIIRQNNMSVVDQLELKTKLMFTFCSQKWKGSVQ